MRNVLIAVAVLVACGLMIAAAQAATSPTNQFPPVAVGAWADSSIAIGTTSAQVLPMNTARKALVLQNNGTGTVSCSDISSPTSLGLGTITIGSSPAAPVKFDGNFVPSGPLYCIASTGTQNLTIKEGR